MSTSPDDRLAQLVNNSSNRGWVPDDDDDLADLLPGSRPLPRRLIVGIVAGVAVLAIIGAVIFAGLRAPSSGQVEAEPALETLDTQPAELTVHVAGAVAQPGVVTLPAGARVTDAIAAAGGGTKKAALNAINLARALTDGEQIYIPTTAEAEAAAAQGRELPAGAAGGTGAPDGTGASGSTGSGSPAGGNPAAGNPAGAPGGPGLVNINTADSAELETLPGVGPATAAAILDYRQQNGPFGTVDDLENVSGIGPATMDKLRPLITVA